MQYDKERSSCTYNIVVPSCVICVQSDSVRPTLKFVYSYVVVVNFSVRMRTTLATLF